MKLSIIIPFYNEEKNIPLVLEEFSKYSDNYDFELICVDDGSKDHTEEVFKNVLGVGKYPFARLISYSPNGGYGYAIMAGVRSAGGEVIAWTHSDLQTDPADVFRAYDLYQKEQGQRIVKGFRVKRKLADAILTAGMSALASVVLKKSFREINAQPKLFGRDLLSHLLNPPSDFSLDLYLLNIAKKNNYKILEIPVEFKKRLYGVSKSAPSFLGRLKTIWRTVKYIISIKNY